MLASITRPAFTACLLGLWLCGWPFASQATSGEIGLHEVTQGELLIETPEAGRYRLAPIQETRVEMRVTGPIARATLTQRFRNPGTDWVEAVYAFPLPEEAAVDHLRMQVGERVIEGRIAEREAARRTYQQAKTQGKRSALVEQHRPNLFTTSVANIPPQGEVSVEIQYQQPLRWQDDRFSLRFPMAMTPRYRPAANARLQEQVSLDGGWAILPGEVPNRVPLDPMSETSAPNPVSLSLSLNPGFPLGEVVSRYHQIERATAADGSTEIRLLAGPVPADRDFLLEWTAAESSTPRAAFFTEQSETGSYGLLMVMPPDAGEPSAIAREVVFIIDTSGSMGGASIRQAKLALIEAIRGLDPRDRFEVIEFNSRTQRLFAGLRAADDRGKAEALGYVAGLDAEGGTEMKPALEAAFAIPDADFRTLRQIVFITDGAVANEAELLGLIRQRLGNRRLFTVGIGSAPNSYFMTEAAHAGRGTFTFIGNQREVAEKMSRLFRQLERPAMTDLALTLPVDADALPSPIPDLYQGQPLVAAMRFDAVPDQAEVSGRIGDTEWQSRLSLNAAQDQAGLGVYWARAKIRQWMRRRAAGADAEKVRSEVTAIGLSHHLVSAYTSLVAVDVTPIRPPESDGSTHAIDGNLPAGWQPPGTPVHTGSTQSLGLGQGATWSTLYTLLGTLLLGLAGLLRFGQALLPRIRA